MFPNDLMGIHILLAMGFQIWIWIRSYIKADLERFTPELRMRDYLDFLDMRFDMRANPYPDSMHMQMDSTPRFASESLRICDHIHIGNCTWNMHLRTNGQRICGPICPGYVFHGNVYSGYRIAYPDMEFHIRIWIPTSEYGIPYVDMEIHIRIWDSISGYHTRIWNSTSGY